MDAIKKKMLSMKMDKENAMDKAEQMEQKLRETEESKNKVNICYEQSKTKGQIGISFIHYKTEFKIDANISY
jgi:hypothetical protein